jgi:2-polyprenyl-6-methoxyphenol hydroxylase-like FAD-dependent oxidoreductase
MTDVLIVGAGPTGLLLAGDLAAAGVACTVLERRGEESNLTRAFAVHARTLEVLDARGLADELIATGQPLGELRLLDSARIDLSTLPSRFPYLLVTPQYETERLLAERARKAGAEIIHGAEVTGLRQDADGVDVEVRINGETVTRRAKYVVGTDGIGSAVRKALGLPFPGRSAVQSVMLADVRLTDAPTEVLTANASGDAFGFMAPFGDGWYRVIAWDKSRQQPDDAPVDLDEIRAVVRRALGTDYGMHDARWLSRFHSDERQVPQYRVGRVFLAGDAAHVHSPAGGQGMNTGLQDAANLGWKLAAAVQGWAPAGLLDTYQDERHPVGRSVLRMSGGLLRFAMLGPRVLPLARALFGLVTSLPAARRRAAGLVSGVGLGYSRPRGAHPLVGRRAPDLPLADGRRLYEALREGKFVLIAPEGEHPDGWRDRVLATNPASGSRRVLLVRPDGYIGWASNHPEPAAVRAALTEWCGPAR